MNDDLFEQARKRFFGIEEVLSVSRDTEREFEEILELASKILPRIKVREEPPNS